MRIFNNSQLKSTPLSFIVSTKEVDILDKILEVCVDSLASARAAISGGANRLELCSALAIGGLSPFPELLTQIKRENNIPIRCLIRPRPGDFLYTDHEIDLMSNQISTLRNLGAEGFVIGCLTADGELDADAMMPMLNAAIGCGLTLHRCIDVSLDLKKTYMDAAALGFDTVLTSGGAASCEAGFGNISQLIQLQATHNGPEILIGAGVNANVIRKIRKQDPRCTAFHMSGKTQIESRMRFRRHNVPMGISGFDEWHISRTDEQAIHAARAALYE